MSLPGAITVIGTVAAYAGGSIQARFQAQGGGAPLDLLAGTTIAGDGTFSLQVWDNSSATYTPSVTIFTILAPNGATVYTTTVYVHTANQDISSAFADAPDPPGGASGVPSVNSITDAVTIAAADSSIDVSTVGSTISIAATGSSGGGGVMKSAVISMSAAAVLALSNSNPTILVAAPGAGKATIPIGLFVRYHSNGTAYSGGSGTLDVGYRGVGGLFSSPLTLASLGMNTTTDSGYSEVENYESGDDLSNFANLDLCFKCTSAAIATAGNGTLKITVIYYTVDVT